MLWLLSGPGGGGGGGGGGGWGLPVGFLLLWYSVVFTVEPFSLLYLFFLYILIYMF